MTSMGAPHSMYQPTYSMISESTSTSSSERRVKKSSSTKPMSVSSKSFYNNDYTMSYLSRFYEDDFSYFDSGAAAFLFNSESKRLFI